MGVQKSEPRWGWKSAVLCGEAAQGLVFLLERGLLQYLVKLALRVVPAPLVLFFLSLCHLKHDLLISCKLKIVQLCLKSNIGRHAAVSLLTLLLNFYKS